MSNKCKSSCSRNNGRLQSRSNSRLSVRRA